MKVLICASEGAPFAKTGGLGDVIGALPGALKENKCDARVIMPYYKRIKEKNLAHYKGYAYVNIAGGMKIQEPAIDLGIVLALLSSFRNISISPKCIAFGEVGLSGEVRSVSMAAQRVAEAKKLGFNTCILPAVCMKGLKSDDKMRLIGINNIQELDFSMI